MKKPGRSRLFNRHKLIAISFMEWRKDYSFFSGFSQLSAQKTLVRSQLKGTIGFSVRQDLMNVVSPLSCFNLTGSSYVRNGDGLYNLFLKNWMPEGVKVGFKRCFVLRHPKGLAYVFDTYEVEKEQKGGFKVAPKIGKIGLFVKASEVGVNLSQFSCPQERHVILQFEILEERPDKQGIRNCQNAIRQVVCQNAVLYLESAHESIQDVGLKRGALNDVVAAIDGGKKELNWEEAVGLLAPHYENPLYSKFVVRCKQDRKVEAYFYKAGAFDAKEAQLRTLKTTISAYQQTECLNALKTIVDSSNETQTQHAIQTLLKLPHFKTYYFSRVQMLVNGIFDPNSKSIRSTQLKLKGYLEPVLNYAKNPKLIDNDIQGLSYDKKQMRKRYLDSEARLIVAKIEKDPLVLQTIKMGHEARKLLPLVRQVFIPVLPVKHGKNGIVLMVLSRNNYDSKLIRREVSRTGVMSPPEKVAGNLVKMTPMNTITGQLALGNLTGNPTRVFEKSLTKLCERLPKSNVPGTQVYLDKIRSIITGFERERASLNSQSEYILALCDEIHNRCAGILVQLVDGTLSSQREVAVASAKILEMVKKFLACVKPYSTEEVIDVFQGRVIQRFKPQVYLFQSGCAAIQPLLETQKIIQGRPVRAICFSDYYFETVDGFSSQHRGISSVVEEAYQFAHDTQVPDQPVDMVFCDIHPNDGSKTLIKTHNIPSIISNLIKLGKTTKHFTFVLDNTLGVIGDEDVKSILNEVGPFIQSGHLQLVVVGSLSKASGIGDLFYLGGVVVNYSNRETKGDFHQHLSTLSTQFGPTRKAQNFFAFMYQYCFEQIQQFIDVVRSNRKEIYSVCQSQMAANKIIALSKAEAEIFYIGFNYEYFFSQFTSGIMPESDKEKFNTLVLSLLMKRFQDKQLPVGDEQSFFLSRQNLQSCGKTLRWPVSTVDQKQSRQVVAEIMAVNRLLEQLFSHKTKWKTLSEFIEYVETCT